MKPVQIDPPGCGCTECQIGLYVPLDQATVHHIRRLFRAELSNATSRAFTYIMTVEDALSDNPETTITVKAEHYDREWTWDPSE